MSSEKFQKLKELIESEHEWPGFYTFKFIVPEHKEQELSAHVAEHEVTRRTSKNGSFIAYTTRMHFESAHEVIEVYQRVQEIEGLLSL